MMSGVSRVGGGVVTVGRLSWVTTLVLVVAGGVSRVGLAGGRAGGGGVATTGGLPLPYTRSCNTYGLGEQADKTPAINKPTARFLQNIGVIINLIASDYQSSWTGLVSLPQALERGLSLPGLRLALALVLARPVPVARNNWFSVAGYP